MACPRVYKLVCLPAQKPKPEPEIKSEISKSPIVFTAKYVCVIPCIHLSERAACVICSALCTLAGQRPNTKPRRERSENGRGPSAESQHTGCLRSRGQKCTEHALCRPSFDALLYIGFNTAAQYRYTLTYWHSRQ